MLICRKILVKKINETAKLPFRSTPGSAGYDIYSDLNQDVTIRAGEIAKIPTGIAIALPDNDCVALLFSRSGMSAKHKVSLANGVGVIDSDYRGEIFVALRNFGDKNYCVMPGERIAQLLFVGLEKVELIKADNELPHTSRGTGGFGSTGR